MARPKNRDDGDCLPRSREVSIGQQRKLFGRVVVCCGEVRIERDQTGCGLLPVCWAAGGITKYRDR